MEGTVYEEDERDVNVLKTVLPLMSRHAAGYHPVSYALWYEYARAIDPALVRCVNEALMANQRLTVESTNEISTRFLLEPAQRALANARATILGLVEQVDAAVSSAGHGAVGFKDRLTEFLQQIARAQSVSDLSADVAAMRAETQKVGHGLDQVSRQLSESRDEVKRLNEELDRVRHDALIDPLSGLLNRRGFDRELARLAAAGGRPGQLALVMIDIDHFKRINDTYGHPLGDRVIAALGRTIRECLGNAGCTARYGGEEFVVLLAGDAAPRAERCAQYIRARVESGRIRRRKGERDVDGITVSAGVAFARPGEDPTAVLERADRALYQSKQGGRNRVTVDA